MEVVPRSRKGSFPSCKFSEKMFEKNSIRCKKNSISQVVPDSWREDAVEASRIIREQNKDCEIIVNADQTFIKLHMENDTVLAPVGTK